MPDWVFGIAYLVCSRLLVALVWGYRNGNAWDGHEDDGGLFMGWLLVPELLAPLWGGFILIGSTVQGAMEIGVSLRNHKLRSEIRETGDGHLSLTNDGNSGS